MILIGVLILRPNGLFNRRRQAPPEPLTGTFISSQRPLVLPTWAIFALATLAATLAPFCPRSLLVANSYQRLADGDGGPKRDPGHRHRRANLAGACGFSRDWCLCLRLVNAAVALALCAITPGGWHYRGVLGTLLVLPAFRLRAHYVAIATLGIGEIVSQVILNWDGLTNGVMGITNITPPAFFGWQAFMARDLYWYSLALLLLVALFQWQLLRSPLGRTWRALREDDVAAQSYGINLNRYKALVFVASAFMAGISGAFTGHMYTYINHETFTNTTSILLLTMVILGGMGNMLGAVVGAVALTVLPELFRGLVDYRYLIYGITLLLLIRFRPQGLLGTI